MTFLIWLDAHYLLLLLRIYKGQSVSADLVGRTPVAACAEDSPYGSRADDDAPGPAVRPHAVLSARRHGFSCPDRTGGSADGPLFFVPAVRFGERIRCAYAARAFCFSELSACGGNSARSAVRAFLSTPLAKPDGRIARRKSS